MTINIFFAADPAVIVLMILGVVTVKKYITKDNLNDFLDIIKRLVELLQLLK